MTVDAILSQWRQGLITRDCAVAALLRVDPVRFQRQPHQAHSFLTLNR